jgi:hypothetical protein
MAMMPSKTKGRRFPLGFAVVVGHIPLRAPPCRDWQVGESASPRLDVGERMEQMGKAIKNYTTLFLTKQSFPAK